MREGGLNELSVRAIAQGIAAKQFTAVDVVRACLERIDKREQQVKAWASLDPDYALSQARACDKAPSRGPLHGVPLGVKDVIDTADLPTQMGSPLYRGHRPAADAACVALVRAAGAIVLGKTVTCEFAGLTPSDTRNPHDLAYSPGGSSSGSAAAVADFMVPAGFGTQTGGSILRPASFCGVVGYKPSFGLVNRGGLKFACESRDTIGLLTGTVEDADLIASVLTSRAPMKSRSDPPRVGLCRTHLWEKASTASMNAVEHAAQKLWAAGSKIREVSLPPSFNELAVARTVINPFERARAMVHEWNTQRDLISPQLRATLEKGWTISSAEYIAALKTVKACRDALVRVFDEVDVLLAPCVTEEAPRGFDTTGDPQLQEFWTALHVPTIGLPTGRGPNGMPLGVQMVAPLYEDETLLSCAAWTMAQLGKA